MNKVEESATGYYSRPQINQLKKELIASIEKEDDIEVLLNWNRMIKAGEEPKPATDKKEGKDDIPDIVLRLLGAGSEIDNEDLNGRESYNRYLKEKYK